MAFFEKIKSALSKTSSSLSKVTDIFTKKGINSDSIDDIEEVLLTSDFGIHTSAEIIKKLKAKKFEKTDDINNFKHALAEIIEEILAPCEKNLQIKPKALNIILFCGVNGNGKTTTIAKLANMYKRSGLKVLVAACDTFRSAAVEQLEIWCERAQVEIVKGLPESDPASVAHSACMQAKEQEADILLIDTAGRLHNQQNLMDQLTKIINVIRKFIPTGPDHTIITLDASTGQNAAIQVEKFKEAANINGIIFTKLDGTAKGGAIVGIASKYKLPIYYITLGEEIMDISEFSATEFANSLISANNG